MALKIVRRYDANGNVTAVVDAVYNPLRTQLIEDAQEREIPAQGGLYMLVMQAVAAVERFLDTEIPRLVGDKVFREIYDAKENIVLTGMPGSGKSTVGRLLASESVAFVDTDAEIEKTVSKHFAISNRR